MLDAKITKISDVCNGAIEKHFFENLKICLANMMDANYSYDAQREIRLTIGMKASKGLVGMYVSSEVKLPKKIADQGIAYLSQDPKNELALFTSDPAQIQLFGSLEKKFEVEKGEK